MHRIIFKVLHCIPGINLTSPKSTHWSLPYALSVFLLIQSLGHASTCGLDETSIAKMPSRQVQIDIFNEKLAALVGPQDAIFIGDSLVQFWPDQLMKKTAHSSKIFNFGVGLDRTENVLWRLRAPQLATLNPKNVVILIGANNLRTQNSPCAIASGIEAVVEQIGEIWPKANRILIQVLPQGDGFSYRDEDRRQTNAMVKEYLESTTNTQILNIENEISCNFLASCVNYQTDHIHLSQAGYEMLSKFVAGMIRSRSP